MLSGDGEPLLGDLAVGDRGYGTGCEARIDGECFHCFMGGAVGAAA